MAATLSDEPLYVRGYLADVAPSCHGEYPKHPLIQPCAGLGLWPQPVPDQFLSADRFQVIPQPEADLQGLLTDREVATPVVLYGHFNDPRADSCPADYVDTCRNVFVAVQVAWVGVPARRWEGGSTTSASVTLDGGFTLAAPPGWSITDDGPGSWRLSPRDLPSVALLLRSRDRIVIDPEEGVADYYADEELHSIAYEWDGAVPMWVVETGSGSSRRSILGFIAGVSTYEVVLDWSAPELTSLLGGFRQMQESLAKGDAE